MSSKTLKAVGAVIFFCLVMIVVVIYIPNRSQKTLEERFEERLERFNQERIYIDSVLTLRKANEAAMRVNTAIYPSAGKEIRFNNKEEPYLEKGQLNLLIEGNTEIIVKLAEVGIAIRNVTKDFKTSTKRTQFKDLIEANTELLTALDAVSEAIDALNKLLQRFTEENTHLHLSPAHAVYDVLVTTARAQDSVMTAYEVYFEYQRAQILNGQ